MEGDVNRRKLHRSKMSQANITRMTVEAREKMSLFKPISLVTYVHGEAEVARAKDKFMKNTTHASVAIRERYKDT